MKKLYTHSLNRLLILGISIIFLNSCTKTETEEVKPVAEPTFDVPSRWAAMTLKIAEKTALNTPTYASRGFGYIGLTMYESIVAGYPEYKSMAGQLNELTTLPQPMVGQKYNYVASLNAGQAYIIKNIYENANDIYKAKIDSLEKVILTEISKNEAKDVVDRSVAYGQSVAKAIYEWSKTDGGHQGINNNFSPDYKLPTRPGTWIPPIFSQSASQLPLHPYWGKNRTFVAATATLPVPKPIPFSMMSNSQYYAQFLEVYAKNRTLTQEEKEIVIWWGDDPSFTFTPPGHAYSLANVAAKTAKANMIKAAHGFAAVGLSIGDAFTTCWKVKYTHHVERPSTYIRRFIDFSFIQFFPEPPFPAFYSGHSVQSGASATALTAVYGENFKFTDNSHEGRKPDDATQIPYKNRSYGSFWEAAEECAYSRFLGGIHTRHDNEIGLIEGRKIGRNIISLQWKK
jgi:hypothetical protein